MQIERDKELAEDEMKRLTKLLFIIVIIFCLSGCGNQDNTKIVFHTGFESNEVFKIDEMICTLPEIMVYLTNIQNEYEEIFSEEIWKKQLGGVTLEENIKDISLARMAQVKVMNLLAKDNEIKLSDEEVLLMEKATAEYYGGQSPEVINEMELTEEIVQQLFIEYATAHKVYDFIIKDINPEISDDEARTITVEHILIKTYTINGSGEKVNYLEDSKTEAFERVTAILEKATEGDDFGQLMEDYNEDVIDTFSFRQGEKEEAFETAAFDLGKDEISGVVETSSGYHIIKCTNTLNREETNANKIEIIEDQKKGIFNEEYSAFVKTLTKKINTELWDSIEFLQSEASSNIDFFRVYEKFIIE